MRLTGLGPLVTDATRVLILGTFPGVESLRCCRYYEDQRNKLWDQHRGHDRRGPFRSV
jgi:G:T/U-mismatch repair DNA glycosylase